MGWDYGILTLLMLFFFTPHCINSNNSSKYPLLSKNNFCVLFWITIGYKHCLRKHSVTQQWENLTIYEQHKHFCLSVDIISTGDAYLLQEIIKEFSLFEIREGNSTIERKVTILVGSCYYNFQNVAYDLFTYTLPEMSPFYIDIYLQLTPELF